MYPSSQSMHSNGFEDATDYRGADPRTSNLSTSKSPFIDTNSFIGPNGPRSLRNGQRRDFFFAWWLELLALIAGIGAFIAIAVILTTYNGQQQPDWKWGLNLNTVIAILSTLLRSSMLVVVGEAISQLKWSWYQKPQPLRNLQQFDAASRGPWGAMLLPFTTRSMQVSCSYPFEHIL
jgi:hypothetical protein